MECSIFINSNRYSLTQFSELRLKKSELWALPAQNFIRAWLNGQEEFSIQTSGSTGKPKQITLHKSQMIASANATKKALDLSDGITALLCINTAYIGGQMMLTRAILGNWDIELVEPTIEFSKLMQSSYDFAAMVPLQIGQLLKTPDGIHFLNNIDKVIIGGAAVSESLMRDILPLTNQMFHTYGMTETVSHIGLKALNGHKNSDWFKVVGDNKIKLDQRGCIQIKGSVTNHKWITTNDIVEIDENRFKWISRADLVVNSGGVKILIEDLEKRFNKILSIEGTDSLAIWKKPHSELGEQLIGISTDSKIIDYIKANNDNFKSELPDYHFPKEWIYVKQFLYTESGKLNRRATFKSATQTTSS